MINRDLLLLDNPDFVLDEDGLFARVYGYGYPLVLLHGNCGSGRVYSKLIPALKDHYRLIVPDLPGHGLGPPMSLNFASDPREATDYILKIARKLDGGIFALCGHSLGGMIGLNLCIEHREMISALILLDSFVGFNERPKELVNIKKFPGNPDELQLEIDEAFADGPGVLWHETFDVSNSMRLIHCPVLELQGEASPGTEALFAEWLRLKRVNRTRDWKVVRIPKSGHFILLEQADLVICEVNAFLHGTMATEYDQALGTGYKPCDTGAVENPK